MKDEDNELLAALVVNTTADVTEALGARDDILQPLAHAYRKC